MGDGENGYVRDDGVEGGQSMLHYWSRLFHRGRRDAAAAVRGEGEGCERREEEEKKEGGS